MRVAAGRSYITVGAFRNEAEREIFQRWTLLGTTILSIEDWHGHSATPGTQGQFLHHACSPWLFLLKVSSVTFIGDALTEKPWGSEYLLCRSSSSALWCLLMHQDASTSFHCHPIKRTGYVVLQGEVMVEFLSSTVSYVLANYQLSSRSFP